MPMTIIGQHAQPGVYLIQTDDDHSFVYDDTQRTAWPPQLIASIAKHGYWEEYAGTPAEAQAILDRIPVPIPASRPPTGAAGREPHE